VYQSDPRNRTAEVSQFSIWFGLFGGVVAWIAHLFIAYALTPFACVHRLEAGLYGASIGTAVVAALALGVAFRAWRASREGPNAGVLRDPVTFLTIAGMLLSGLFLLAIVAQSVPIVLGDPCQAAGSLRF
jgi:uncharacterized membrane protein